MHIPRRVVLPAYEWVVGIIGLLLGLWLLPNLVHANWLVLLYLFALGVALEVLVVPVGKVYGTLITALPVGVMVAYGGADAMWVMIVAESIAPWLSGSKQKFSVRVFNVGQYAIAVFAMVTVYGLVVGHQGSLALSWLSFAAMMLGSLVFLIVNHALIHAHSWLRGAFEKEDVQKLFFGEGINYLISLPFAILMVALTPNSQMLGLFVMLPIIYLGQMLRIYRKMALLQMVHQSTARLASEFDIDRISEEAARTAFRLTNPDTVAIHMYDVQSDRLLPNLIYPLAHYQEFNPDGWADDGSDVVFSILKGGDVSAYIPDTLKDDRVRSDGAGDVFYRSMAIFPIRSHASLLGTLVLYSRRPYAFNDLLDYVEILAAQCGVLIENAKLYQELQEQSWCDAATGLYNYRYFYEALGRKMDQALAQKQHLTVVIVDIDNFKRFNDTYGHLVGDEVLKSVAGLLRRNLGENAIVARYGGEEFGIIMETDLHTAFARMEEIRQEITRHIIHYDNYRLQNITVSIGIAGYPEHSTNDRDLLLKADSALYWGAKQRGKNRSAAYSPEFDSQLFVDSLTSLYTAHFITIRLREEIQRGTTTWGAVCIDLSHFGQVNAAFGFAIGDRVLKQVSLLIRETLRQSELACRYDGEEFLILLPDVTEAELNVVGERVVREISGHRFDCGGNVTLSLRAKYDVLVSHQTEDATTLLDRISHVFATLNSSTADESFG